MIGLLFLGCTFGSAVLIKQLTDSEVYSYSSQEVSFNKVFSIGDTSWVCGHDRLFITSHVKKTDAYVETSGGTIFYKLKQNSLKLDDEPSIWLPSLGYGENEFHISAWSIQSEAWQFDQEADNQDVLQYYMETLPKLDAEIVYDGLDAQNTFSTSVILRISASSPQIFNGNYNICFYQYGKIVFGDIGYFYNDDKDSNSLITTYDAGTRIPSYDKVTVTLLN